MDWAGQRTDGAIAAVMSSPSRLSTIAVLFDDGSMKSTEELRDIHMNIETQNNPEMASLAELIKEFTVAMLTNADASGALVSHPMTPLAMDEQGAIWFFTDSRYTLGEDLAAVNLSFANADTSTFVSLAGGAQLIHDLPRTEKLWTSFAKPWFPAGPSDPNLTLLKFVPETAQYWDAPNNKALRAFAMAASIVASKPIGMGKTETLTAL